MRDRHLPILLCGIFVVVGEIVVPQIADEIVAIVVERELARIIVDLFLDQSLAVILVDHFYIRYEAGQLYRLDHETDILLVGGIKHFSQLGYTSHHICVEIEVHMEKELVTRSQLISVGTESLAGVCVVL